MICPHCHQQHPGYARFCPNTGQEILEEMFTCPKCGSEVTPDLKACGFCGYDLASAATELIPTTHLPSSPGSTPPPTVSATRNKNVFKNPALMALFAFLVVAGLVLMCGGAYLIFFREGGGLNAYLNSRDVPEERGMAEPDETEPADGGTASTAILDDKPLELTTTSVPKETLLPSPTVTLIATPTITLTTTPTITLTATPSNQPLGLQVNSIDGAELVWIPGGEFMMGSDRSVDPYFYGAEGPQHLVRLDEFWIYRTEVTNAMYQQCVAVQSCPRPTYLSSNTRPDYYDNPTYANYPVVYVSWVHAAAYCRWSGGRLPTEAEWEMAGRGTDGRLFPWGDQLPNDRLARYNTNDTAMVGSYPDGASPYGVLDMAGNVIEWVQDYFQATYYSVSPEENPLGPVSGSTRVYRGGAYHNPVDGIRVVMRGSRAPDHANVDIGFRCVIELP